MNQDSERARAEGNASFKKGRWLESIEHYTSATEYNPKDPIAFCNRAQAYLKLEKYADAEKDCTIALELQHDNIKALYRRAIARKELGKIHDAISDLQELLKHSPGNIQAQTELEELKAIQPPPPKKSFADLRQSRDSKKTYAAPTIAEVKKAQIVPTREVPLKVEPAPTVTLVPPTDTSSAGAGVHLLRQLSNLPIPQAAEYLNFYPTGKIHRILGDLLDPENLGKLLLVLQYGASTQPTRILEIMQNLRSTPRFDMNVMMLSRSELEAGKTAWSTTGGEGSWP